MTAAQATLAPPRGDLKTSVLKLLSWVAIIGILGWAWDGAEMRPLEFLRSSGNMATFAKDFFPPDFRDWKLYLQEMTVTVQIAIWGTALAVVLAIPLGILSSSNVVPWWVYQPMRRAMDALRSINEMVWALLFVTTVGLGPFTGVLALFVHTTGILAKLFSEAVEACDPGPVEGIRSTGSSALGEIVYGIMPQVLPLWISFALYRFESNIRAATVVGIVGAGGIGVVLWEVIRSFHYAQTTAAMIFIIVTVSLFDVVSAQLRKLFI